MLLSVSEFAYRKGIQCGCTNQRQQSNISQCVGSFAKQPGMTLQKSYKHFFKVHLCYDTIYKLFLCLYWSSQRTEVQRSRCEFERIPIPTHRSDDCNSHFPNMKKKSILFQKFYVLMLYRLGRCRLIKVAVHQEHGTVLKYNQFT